MERETIFTAEGDRSVLSKNKGEVPEGAVQLIDEENGVVAN